MYVRHDLPVHIFLVSQNQTNNLSLNKPSLVGKPLTIIKSIGFYPDLHHPFYHIVFAWDCFFSNKNVCYHFWRRNVFLRV